MLTFSAKHWSNIKNTESYNYHNKFKSPAYNKITTNDIIRVIFINFKAHFGA